MADEAVVRRARARDVDVVASLWTLLTEHHAALDPQFALRPGADGEVRRIVEAQLRDPEAAIFLAGRGGQPQGLAIAVVLRAPPIHPEVLRGEITDLFVRPEARRAGLGRALLAACLDWTRRHGVARVEVRVAAGNEDGRAFWRAQGFGDYMDVLERRL